MGRSRPMRPSVLIEEWLPIAEVGAESQRERGASSALPPLYFLHVWWARRPLLTSRAAVLASLLPQWRPDWPTNLQEQFPTEKSYRQWFTRLIGILGDPVAGREVARAKAEAFERQGIRGVDLYISTFDPTLSIISEHWPVLTSEVDLKTG